ncbi:MAG: hypothetical protein ACFFEL_02775 [Candidatus Thorarchaeota archaeon]
MILNPLPPPPLDDLPSEIYSDELFIRSLQLGVGAISALILFVSIIAYLWVQSGEE